jgi:hypothetical protein
VEEQALATWRWIDKFLERKFPESRRKAYYLMAIHEQLPRIHKLELQQVGWAKATELAKVARRDGQRFDSATWLHKARELPKEEFKREVSKHLTGKETEPWEILYFKAYKSRLPVIEQALETAALMVGTDKSRGYCLEMICADFLAGVSLEAGDRDALLPCRTHFRRGRRSHYRYYFSDHTVALAQNIKLAIAIDRQANVGATSTVCDAIRIKLLFTQNASAKSSDRTGCTRQDGIL